MSFRKSLILFVLWSSIAAPATAIRVRVVAHAGGAAEGPENTLPAIENAFAAGADWVEVDVRRTLDGELILMHDATVDRTTDGTGAVAEMTLSQIRELDAGSSFGPQFAGTPVPTLAEALVAAQGQGRLLLDFKAPPLGESISEVLLEVGAAPGDIFGWATSGSEVLDAAVFLPGTEMLFQGFGVDTALIEFLAQEGVRGISIAWPELTQELVDDAHARGLEVYVFATTSLTNFETAIGLGIDGIHAVAPSQVNALVGSLPCVDGIDNDGDGFIDYDGLDTDFDGQLEFLADSGCDDPLHDSELSECQDGIDNDSDGFMDAADPACLDAASDRESSQCQDGINNDPGEDPDPGLVDFDGGQSIHGVCAGGFCPPGVSDPDGDGIADPDPQCVDMPWKDSEMKARKYSCGLGFELALILPGLMWLRKLRREDR